MHLPPATGFVPALLMTLGGLLAAVPATAVTVTCGTASGLAGQTVTVSVNTADLTGLNVVACQFRLAYNAAVVTATGVSTAGTLAGDAGWSTPAFNPTSGRIDVAAAGTSALAGAGAILNVTFLINPALLSGSSTTLTLSNFLLNEGYPLVTTANGSITVNATPRITVTPNTGEIVRGATLQFYAGGSVVSPVAWASTDAGVATIDAAGLLTAVGPGVVRAFAVDNAGKRDTTDGDILVHPMGVTVGTASALLNQTVSVPVTVTNLTGLGVRFGEFQITFDNRNLSFNSANRPSGALLDGYGSMNVGASSFGTTTRVTVSFAGSTDLAGAGTLFDLNLTAGSTNYGSAELRLGVALFNETVEAMRINGTVNIAAPATYTVNPANVTLLAGQTQQFTLTGSPGLPVIWSTLDPAVATITSTGLLTAVAGGVTRVCAADNSGGIALNTSVTAYDFALTVTSVTTAPGAVTQMPLSLDRTIGALGVYGVELSVGWSPAYVTAVSFPASGLLSSWGTPTTNLSSGLMRVAAAGSTALSNGGQVLGYLSFTTSATTPIPTDIPITLTMTTFNEGKPIAQITNGMLRVRSGVDVPDGADPDFALGPPRPNPSRGLARLSFTLPSAAAGGAPVRLMVFGTDGRRVRMLVDRRLAAGRHEVSWDTRDGDGRPVPTGLYFCRIEWMGQTLERKLAVLH
jgi:hypothetical protein